MQTLGMKLGNLQQFIFSGPQIDAEQIVHQNRSEGLDINKIGIEIFLQLKNGRYILSDELSSILGALDNGEVPVNNKKLKKVVDSFVEKMYLIPNIREGWLDHIRNILYGLEPFYQKGSHPFITHRVEDRLLNVEYMYRESGKVIPQPAVVLEIDTEKLIQSTSVDGLFPVLIGNRPIESIFPSLTIVPQAINGAYTSPKFVEKMPAGSIPIMSLDEIADDKWLGGINWRNANPTMDSPLCAIRYTQGNQTTWWEIANAGFISPAKTIEQNALFVPPMVLTEVFGKDYFSFTSGDSFKNYPGLFDYAINQKFGNIQGVFNRWEAI